MYKNNHTCAAKKKKISIDVIKSELAKNPGVKPSQFVNSKLSNIMSENFEWKDVVQVASNFVDMKRVYNARENLKKKLNPQGQNFEALAFYKQKCEEKDKFYIHKVNNRALNGKPSFVFKSSVSMASLCIQMDRDKLGILRNEFAFVDAKHDRCRNFKTITLWTYHPVMLRVVCLATMEAEEESADNLVTFWSVLNEMLQELTGNPNVVFNPVGFVADENQANWKSIGIVFGREALKRAVSCEFHYKESVERHKKGLGGLRDSFKEKSWALLYAQTINEFNAAYSEISQFIVTNNLKQLESWLAWWNERRSHVFQAFKLIGVPAANLAEVGHAKMTSAARSYMSLLEAARDDVSSAIRQETELAAFESGISRGGKGPDALTRIAKEHKESMKRARAFADELDAKGIELDKDQTSVLVPPKGKHRPPDSPISKKRTVSQLCEGALPPSERQPFHLVLFGSILNVKRCYGCGLEFKNKQKKEPNDLLLKQYCYRRYKDKKSGNYMLTKNLQAAYFHLNLDCARKQEPRMELRDVLLHKEVACLLTDGHKRVLRYNRSL